MILSTIIASFMASKMTKGVIVGISLMQIKEWFKEDKQTWKFTQFQEELRLEKLSHMD